MFGIEKNMNMGSNPKAMKKGIKAALKGDTEGVKEAINDNMKSIEDYWNNPARRTIALIAIKVKCPEVYNEAVQAGKSIEQKKMMSGEKKYGPNLKKMVKGDLYYAEIAYSECQEGLSKYYDTVRKVLGIEEKQEEQEREIV